MQKKLLVTGATGLLGLNLTKHFIKEGFAVKVFVRPTSDCHFLKELNCSIIKGNLNSLNDLENASHDCNFVIHCASMTNQNSTDFEAYKKVNVDGTKSLILACKKNKVKKFIFVSSANCFTNGTLENPGTENSKFMPFLEHSGYAYSKYLAQKIVLREAQQNDLPAIIVAPTFMIGPYDSKPSSGALMLYILKKKLLFYPKGGKSFVDVNSVCIAIKNTLKTGKIGECYLLSGVNMSYREYYQKVLKVTGRKSVLVPIPKIMIWVLDLLYFINPSERVRLLRCNLRALFLHNYFSNAKAKEELYMPETHIEASISKSIKWFSKNNYLSI